MSHARNFVQIVVAQICVAVGIALLSGCNATIIKSTKLNDSNPPHEFQHYYALPKALLTVEIVPDADVDEKACDAQGKKFFKEEIKLVPDQDHRYQLRFLSNAAFKDTIKITTNDSGILTKVTTMSTDESVTVTNKLLALATEIEKLSKVATFSLPSPVVKVVGSPNCETISGYLLPSVQEILLGKYRVSVKKVLAPTESVNATAPAKTLPTANNNNCPGDGICYRPLAPYLIEVRENGKSQARLSKIVLLPDVETTLSLQISRAPFVAQKADFTFKDGMLTESDIDRPSSVAGFVDIPINIAKALVSIPAALLDLKITNTKKESSVADEQLKLLKKQQELLDELVKQQKKPTP